MESQTKSVRKILLLLLCSYYSLSIARAADGQRYKVLATGSLKSEGVCSSELSATPLLSSVPLNHRFGPCSPVLSAKKPTIVELLDNDKIRAEYIQQKFFEETGAGQGSQQLAVTVPAILGFSLDTAEYIISVSIGSPAVKQNMIMDTGSDVSWVHCVSGSLFDPKKSSTYAPFSCSSAACTQLGSNTCSSSQCQYMVRYGDGSNTTGTYGSDKLALTKSAVVNGFRFGCSLVEAGFADEKVDGLMGLGRDTESLVSQTAATYGTAFSYCLPPTSATSGFLTLGTPSNASGFVTTPLIETNETTFYRVLLQGISVGGRPLNIPTSVFSTSGGSIMDSGTVITRLPQTAYTALKTAFRAGMTMYPLAKPVGILDTCYDFTRYTKISVPAVKLAFSGGAVMDLDFDGIMYDTCLAFGPTTDLSIIGNVQQRTFEMLHDVGKSILGFRPEAC